jgi:hypothetical protein
LALLAIVSLCVVSERFFGTVLAMFKRDLRCFTTIELVMVCLVLLIVTGLGFMGFKSVEDTGSLKNTQIEMVQVEGLMLGFYQARGFYPQDQALVASLEPDLFVTSGPSSSNDSYSLAVSVDDQQDILGIAVLDHSGSCVASRIAPTDSDVTRRSSIFKPTVSQPCSGFSALSIVGLQW